MSCESCKQHISYKKNESFEKARLLAAKIAEIDGKTQIILEYEGNLSITCEECWIKGGRIGKPIEYFIA